MRWAGLGGHMGQFAASPRMVRAIDDLTFSSQEHLRRALSESGRLPTRADLVDPDDFATRVRRHVADAAPRGVTADEALHAALKPDPGREEAWERLATDAAADTSPAVAQRPVAAAADDVRTTKAADGDRDDSEDAAARRARERAAAQAAARRERHLRRAAAIATVRAERAAASTEVDLIAVLAMKPADLVPYVPGMTEKQITDAHQQVQAFVKSGIPLSKFGHAYEEATAATEAAPKPSASPSMAGCFDEAPRVAFADAVRILGRGDLIRVDETFLRYSPGELSYVQTVLAGELRERELKRLTSTEEITERSADDTLEPASGSSCAHRSGCPARTCCANGVSPPPAPIVTIGRLYTTDVTNVAEEQGDSTFEKVVDVPAPFFEQYQRLLITDAIRLPGGSAVADVNVTVSHGKNGVSIPAHLP